MSLGNTLNSNILTSGVAVQWIRALIGKVADSRFGFCRSVASKFDIPAKITATVKRLKFLHNFLSCFLKNEKSSPWKMESKMQVSYISAATGITEGFLRQWVPEPIDGSLCPRERHLTPKFPKRGQEIYQSD